MTTPPRTLGSVFPFPLDEIGEGRSLWAAWTDGFAHASVFQSARSALRALLTAEKIKRLWLPAYICAETASAAPVGCGARFYGAGPGLALQPFAPEADDAALGVDYFGRRPCAEFLDFVSRHPEVLWIEDRAQAMQPDSPAWGDVVLYSPRKLIGVADGGVMVSNQALPAGPTTSSVMSSDLWAAHMARYDDPDGAHPEVWGPMFQRREATFAPDPTPMSAMTRDLLGRIPIAPLAERRRANYARLSALLPDHVLWTDDAPAFAPLAYPIRVKDAADAVRRLAGEGLFCARHWADLPSPAAEFPAAHALAGQLVSLPCDHRYGAADMDRLAAAARRLPPA